MATTTYATLPLLHRFLGIGSVMLAVAFFVLKPRVPGEPVSLIATGLGIVAFWLCGPNVFAKA